jgi:hypothetical protein
MGSASGRFLGKSGGRVGESWHSAFFGRRRRGSSEPCYRAAPFRVPTSLIDREVLHFVQDDRPPRIVIPSVSEGPHELSESSRISYDARSRDYSKADRFEDSWELRVPSASTENQR